MYAKKELSLLENLQGKLRLPPYFPLLFETGTLTVEARLHYKKLMLYHHIIKSDYEIKKKIILNQMEERIPGTWYYGIYKLMIAYELTDKSEETGKSKWKKIVKINIRDFTENMIRQHCGSKGRTVLKESYTVSTYIKETKKRIQSKYWS